MRKEIDNYSITVKLAHAWMKSIETLADTILYSTLPITINKAFNVCVHSLIQFLRMGYRQGF